MYKDMKMRRYIIGFVLTLVGVGIWSSCEDMLEPDSEYVLYDEHLSGPADTATSVIGILYKLQSIADRINLLGEVRGDLVKVNNNGSSDLRELAQFAADDDNKYNDPRDFYSVINNCNYFIEYADMSQYDNRGNQIFEKEVAQVKAIRAWTYLQLVLAYGKVPFYTDALLTEQDAEAVSTATADRKDLSYICDYFISELTPLVNTDWPQLHYVNSVFIPMCYYPVSVVLGELYLWKASLLGVEAGKAYYREAARYYWNWIVDTRYVSDGLSKSIYYVSSGDASTWSKSSGNFGSDYRVRTSTFSMTASTYGGQYFTVIPMDSASHQGYYSELRSLYNTSTDDNTMSYVTTTNYSLEPSDVLREISQSQHYCFADENDKVEDILVDEMEDEPLLVGDLRLYAQYSTNTINTTVSGYATLFTVQNISKTNYANVGVNRQRHVWLRLAEALNNGGLPRLAFAILSTGFDADIINDTISKYLNTTDLAFVQELNGGNNYFNNYKARKGNGTSSSNMIGIHSLGCGFAELDTLYAYPEVDSLDVDSNRINGYAGEDAVTWAYQNLYTEMASVDSLLITEMALETCFEGRRLYDLIRYAKRYGDNTWVANAVGARDEADSSPVGLRNKLMSESNWYLSWGNSIGW